MVVIYDRSNRSDPPRQCFELCVPLLEIKSELDIYGTCMLYDTHEGNQITQYQAVRLFLICLQENGA
jgi:hypothetical protein